MRRFRTGRGDDGTTGLRSGPRVPKDHPRVEALGALDELSAALGAAAAFCRRRDVRAALGEIQQDLRRAGARLADPRDDAPGGGPSAARVETLLDRFRPLLPPLRDFVVRGGPPGAALLHWACTVCRRAERRIVALARSSPVPPPLRGWINRLSTLLFALARLEDRRRR